VADFKYERKEARIAAQAERREKAAATAAINKAVRQRAKKRGEASSAADGTPMQPLRLDGVAAFFGALADAADAVEATQISPTRRCSPPRRRSRSPPRRRSRSPAPPRGGSEAGAANASSAAATSPAAAGQLGSPAGSGAREALKGFMAFWSGAA
jgi:hypothetical protein